MSLGHRIARLRQERGQTLQDVANGAGLTPSFLSRLERDQVNISVANLRKLAQFFGVSMTYFFEDEERGPAAVVTRVGERIRLSQPRASVQVYALTPPLSGIDARLVEASVGASGSSDGAQMLFVVGGQLRCQVDDDVFTLNAGDTLVARRAAQVRWDTLGDATAVLLVQVERD
jgi:transcriptional regulator with XRE-family HTH domain